MTFCDKWLFWLFRKWIKKVVFICIYKINRTLHGRLGIRILSSRAESIPHSFASLTRERYFHHSKIKFVSPRGHVTSSINPTRADGIIVNYQKLDHWLMDMWALKRKTCSTNMVCVYALFFGAFFFFIHFSFLYMLILFGYEIIITNSYPTCARGIIAKLRLTSYYDEAGQLTNSHRQLIRSIRTLNLRTWYNSKTKTQHEFPVLLYYWSGWNTINSGMEYLY